MEKTTVKTPSEEPKPDNPNRTHPLKPTNGFLKLRAAHAPYAPPLEPHTPPPENPYHECRKNHAASIGGHALDGCGEFMPAATSLLCAACGCHRNFHRHVVTSPRVEYQPHQYRHVTTPSRSASPPPISSAYYPNMLLSLSSPNANHNHNSNPRESSRKRFRTKFTQSQKERMYELAEKLTWKMQRRDEDVINEFCSKIGVDKRVFKVWMHNNKNTIGKKESTAVNGINVNGNGINLDNVLNNNGVNHLNCNNSDHEVSAHPANGSSSSC